MRTIQVAPIVLAALVFVGAQVSCSAQVEENLRSIQLPPGFEISIYAKDVPDARSMALGSKGTLFVGSQRAGNVYAVVDENGDYKADKVYTILRPGRLPDGSTLMMPSGIAFKDGALYVGAVSHILRFDDIESRLANPPAPVIVTSDYPTERHHGWKYIAFGPDGKLYVPVGAPCNICEREEIFASITRMNPDGTGREIIAHGVRNTVGFDWHPRTGELWFTENGRDMMGDDMPADELNRLERPGQHFGFPYVHQGDTLDPMFGKGKSVDEFVKPAMKLGPHVAALGMKFYTGRMFPEQYRNQIFIAEHGSWNRSQKIGYRIMVVRLQGNDAVSYEPFAEGWLQGQRDWGRPVDLLVLPDGSMLVSDDKAGVIYRITYRG